MSVASSENARTLRDTPKRIRTEQFSGRATPSELARIDARAQARGISRTEYMIGASLGTLDIDPADTEARFDALEERMARLEDLAARAGA